MKRDFSQWLYSLIFLFFFIKTGFSQYDTLFEQHDFRIMFYNCENYFDTFHDTLKLDNEFLPTGKKYWTWKKYMTKQNHIGKVIIAVGGWQPPDLVGLCEIENRNVLNGLVTYSPIKNFGYQIIHKESPDRRGIDVALLYLQAVVLTLWMQEKL
jgi:hypothetical protein